MKNITGILLITAAFLFNIKVQAQAVSDKYAFVTDTNASLIKSYSGAILDMSDASVVLNNGVADRFADEIKIAEPIWFMGKPYNRFYVHSSGLVVLADGTAAFSYASNSDNSFQQYAGYAHWAPFWDKQRVKGEVKFKIFGSFPDRVIVTDWKTKLPDHAGGNVADCHYQVRFYEKTGQLEYVYGDMNIGANAAVPVTATIGFSINGANANNTFLHLTDLDSFTINRSTTLLTNHRNLVNSRVAGNIKGLNGNSDSTCRRFIFTPQLPVAPNNLGGFNVTATEALLYWDDNSTSETAFRIYRSFDGIYRETIQTGADINFTQEQNLKAGKNYGYVVGAQNAVGVSYTNIASFTTLSAPLSIAVQNGNWSDTNTWLDHRIPSASDAVYISGGFKVIIDTTLAICYSLTIDTGQVEFQETLPTRILEITGDLDIKTMGELSGPDLPALNNLNHQVKAGGNFNNEGKLDLHRVNSNITWAASLEFYGNGKSRFTGTGGNDLFLLKINKSRLEDTVLILTDSLLVAGSDTDLVSNRGFLQSNGMIGTVVFAGRFRLENRLFSISNYDIPVSGAVVIDNPGFTVTAQNNNVTVNGILEIRRGVFNHSKDAAYLFTLNSTARYIQSGGEVNLNGRTAGAPAGFELYGGKLNLGSIINTTVTPTFSLTNTNAVVKFTGGEIRMIKAGTNTGRIDYRFNMNTSMSTFGGTKMYFNGDSGTVYMVSGVLPNVIVDSISGRNAGISLKLLAELNIKGKFELPSWSRIYLANFKLTLAGDTNLVDGIIDGSTSQVVSFNGNTNQVVLGKGKLITYGLEFYSETPGNTFDIASDTLVYVNNFLALRQGTVKNAENITIGNGVNAVAFEFGLNGVLNDVGNLDSMPVYNIGTGSLSISYLDETKDRTTGTEIPTNRSLYNLTINTNQKLRITGGDLKVTNVLSLQKGKAESFPGNELVLENGAASAVNIGSSTAYIIGTLKRKINANQTTASGYYFPVGGNQFKRLELFNLQTKSALYLRAGFVDSVFTASKNAGIDSLGNGYWFFKAENADTNFVSGQLKFYDQSPGGFKNIARAMTKSSTVTVNDTFNVFGYRGVAFADRDFYFSEKITGFQDSVFQLFNLSNASPVEISNDTFYVGNGKDLENLTAVANKLRSSVINGNTWFIITSDYTDAAEIFPVVFDTLAYGPSKGNVYIGLDKGVIGKRTGNQTKALAAGTSLIYLDGPDQIEFNGEGYDFSGIKTGKKEWVFLTETNTNNLPVFKITDDASGVTLRGLELRGNAALATSATVVVETSAAPVTGHDGLVIESCLFTSGSTYPQNHFYTSGAGLNRTDNVVIKGNEFTNFLLAGISVPTQTAGNNWSITGNHFYDAANQQASNRKAIDFRPAAGSAGHDISGNFIGGSARYTAGTSFTYNGTAAMIAMELDVDTTVPSLVQGNSIKNMTQSSASTTSYWIGIKANTGSFIISGNKVGGNSATDYVNIAGLGTSSGIYLSGTGATYLVSENEISFIRHTSGNNANQALTGIEGRGNASFRINNNHIHDLLSLSAKITVPFTALQAIYLNGSNLAQGAEIADNRIYNLSVQNRCYMLAIGTEGVKNGIIENNDIRKLLYQNTSTVAGVVMGVHVNSGSWDIRNNMILLDMQATPGRYISLQGIRSYSTDAFDKVYNNTILLNGTAINSHSYGLVHGSAAVRAEFRNNIVINNMTITGGFYPCVMHYASVSSTYFAADNNLYYSKDSSKGIYDVSTAAPISFSTYRSRPYDKNSVFQVFPVFTDSLNDLHLKAVADNRILKAAGVRMANYDFDKEVRNSIQNDIGADEFNIPMLQLPLFVSGNDTLCEGAGRTLIASNPNTSGKVEWFASAGAIDTLATGDTFTIASLSNNTTLYLQVKDDTSRSYRIPVSIAVRRIPVLTFVNQPADTLCSGTSTELVFRNNTSVNAIRWYSDSLLQNQVAGSWNFNTGNLTNDTAFYYIYETASCLSDTQKVKIQVNENVTLTAPVLAAPVEVCKGTDAFIQPISSSDIRWFSTPTSQAFLVDTALTIPNLLADTTLYVESFNGSCKSEKVAIHVVALPIPAKATTDTSLVVCAGDLVNLQASGSGFISWYADDTTSTPLANGGSYLFGPVNSDTTVYVINESITCTSERTRINLVKNSVPAPMKGVAPVICYGADARLTAFAPGRTIEWFDDQAMTILLSSDTVLDLVALTADKTVYVRVKDGICIGPVDSMTVSVGQQVTDPSVTGGVNICYGSRDTLRTQSPGNISWFETLYASNPVNTGLSFVTPAVTNKTTWYAQADFGNGCVSNKVPYTINPIALPKPPLFDSITAVCRGNIATLKPVVSTGDIYWYSSLTSPTPLSIDSQFVTAPVNLNTTYYVQSFDGTCFSNRIPVRVLVRNAPANLQLLNTDPICMNTPAALKVSAVANTQSRWYADLAGTQELSSDTIFYSSALSLDTVFYVRSFDGVCYGSMQPYPVMVLDYLTGVGFTLPDSIAINTNFDFSTGGAATNLYSWSFGSGASIGNASGMGPFGITWTTEGTKNIRLYVQHTAGATSCDTTITKQVVVYDPSKPGVSVKNVGELHSLKLHSLKLYPNPAFGQVHLEAAFNQSNVKVKLVNVLGSTVWEQNYGDQNSLNVLIGTETFTRGVYLLVIELNGRTYFEKIILQ